MSRQTPSMDGLLVLERCLYDTLEDVGAGATDSSYTEAGPRPGHAIYADARGRVEIEISHAQSESATIVIPKGGQPGRDGIQLAYRPSDENALTRPRYWETPANVTGYAPWGSSSMGSHDVSAASVCVIPSSQVVLVAYSDTNTNTVHVSAISVGEVVTDVDTTYALDASWGDGIALVVLPDERVLLYVGRTAYYSDDEGATWAAYAESVVTETVTTYGRTVVLCYRGDLLMLVQDDTTAATIHQLASTDGGVSFALVGSFAGLGESVWGCVNEDGIHLAWTLVSATDANYRRLAGVHEELDLVTPTTVYSTSNRSTIVSDAGGTLYVLAGSSISGGRVVLASSIDSGETWTTWQSGCIELGNTADDVIEMRAVWQCGRIALACGYSDGGTANDGGGVLYLGGWSNVVGRISAPALPESDAANRWGWYSRTGSTDADGETWFAQELPNNSGWTGSGGAGTPSLHAEGSVGIASVANALAYFQTTAAACTGLLVRARVKVVSGGSLATSDVVIGLRLANNTVDYEIAINLITTGFAVVDGNSAANLATITRDMTGFTDIMAWMNRSGDAKVVYRAPGSTVWTVAYDGAGVTNDGATPNAEGLVIFGHVATATAESRWREVHFAAASSEIPRLSSLSAAVGWGKPINARPEPIPDLTDADGLVARLACTSGPGRVGDGAVIAPAYDHGLRNCHAEITPSPRTRWRSTSTAEQVAVYDLGDTGWTGQALGLFVTGANFRTIYLENYVGGSWVTRATLDLATGFTGLTPTIGGDMVYPNTATTASASRWLFEGEIVNGWVKGTAGGTGTSRILAQSAGGWAQTSPVLPMLQVEDGSDLSGVTECALVAPSGLAVWYPTTMATTLARYWRWRIPAGTAGADTPTGESYYEAGAILLGRVQAFGAAWSWGRGIDVEPNVARFRAPDGGARARKRGPVARSWSMGWPDQQSLMPVRVSMAPDHVGPASGHGLAAHQDVAYQLHGLIEGPLDGGARPCVAIARLPDETGVITDRTRYLYGHLTSGVRSTQALGSDVGTDEVLRTETITIEECV